MEPPGSVQYRGNKIYLNRKTLLQTGRWKWIQEATGLERGQENAASTLLYERNHRELAKHELHAIVVRRRNTTPSPLNPSVREFSSGWVARRKMRELTSAFDDVARFRTHVLPFVVDGVGEIGDVPLREVRPAHIRAWIEDVRARELAPRSVRNLYSMVRAMFADAYADELVDQNPCRLRRTDLPVSEDRDPRWRVTALFSRDEVIALLSDARLPLDRRTLYATALLTASRSGELSALRVRDYDTCAQPLARLTVAETFSVHLRKTKPTKTRVTRLVPVHPALRRMLDDWLRFGFNEAFGRAPRADDLMFPLQDVRHGPSYRRMLAVEPSLTRADLARRIGVSRAAITQALRERPSRMVDLSTAFRTPQTNYKLFQRDLRALGLRPRRLHDTKRTAVSLLTEDGVRDPILTYIAWGPRNNVRDLYISLSWQSLCEEMLKLKLRIL